MWNPLKTKRFKIKPFINGQGWAVFDVMMHRVYKAYQIKEDAIKLRNYLNKKYK